MIVRWEILNGLPAEGPVPKYFHGEHPTPWAEGFVVRFWNEDGSSWVANFQAEAGEGHVFDLPGSTSLVVIAYGDHYSLPMSDPDRCSYVGWGVRSALVDDENHLLILAYCGGDLAAFRADGSRAWIRPRLGADGIRLISCARGMITADVEYDYEGNWRPVSIRALDGTSW